MKRYIWNGESLDKLPGMLKLNDGSIISPITEEIFLEYGGETEEDGEPTPEESFQAACEQFRALCDAIGLFIGDPSFMGGFDEYAEFAGSEAYRQDPVRGNVLAIQWSALNELCKYKGARAGYGQPDWWYRCWEYAERV